MIDCKEIECEDNVVKEWTALACEYEPSLPSSAGLTPKTKKLISLVKKFAGESGTVYLLFMYRLIRIGFCAIIFVERRVTAWLLAHILQSHDDLKNSVRCGVLVGHQKSNDVIMRSREQVQIIRDFQQQRINVLLSTSVGEEGTANEYRMTNE
jgi:ERCC4-related helicase